MVLVIPVLPRTAGMLKQHPNSGWKWLIGRTFRLSSRIDEQMLHTTEPRPNGHDPLARMISLDRFLHACSSSDRSSDSSDGLKSRKGMEPIVAADHVTTWASPSTPKTYMPIEFAAT